jgi:arylsulfatase A-like enzyme
MKHWLLAGCIVAGMLTGVAQAAPPNILVILADDLGWKDLGCTGSTFYETPRLDQLAAEGVRFTHAYTAGTVCSPTRASILTGKYPARLATTDYFGGPQPDAVEKHWTAKKPLLPAPYLERLPLEEVTLAEALREGGYATFFAGKWHLGGVGFLPGDQGFSTSVGNGAGGFHYFSPYKNPGLPDGPPGEYVTYRLAQETANYIDAHEGGPFFAYLCFNAPHVPLVAPEDLVRKYEAKRAALAATEPDWPEGAERSGRVRQVQDHAVYAAMIEAMDTAIGTVIDALKRKGLYENTVIVFTSDNGGLSTAEGHPTSNLPLRAGKGWLYEGGTRVPLIYRLPQSARAGSTSDTPVLSTDLYPTLLELAGLPGRPDQHRDGLSAAPLLRGETPPQRDALYWHYPHYGNQGGSPGAAIQQDPWKLIHFFEDSRNELYNLNQDPGEQHDLAEKEPERVAAMSAQLRAWQEEVGAQFPTPNPAKE